VLAGPGQSPVPPPATTPIVILGLAGLAMHHGALGAMRSAGRLGVPVYLAHDGRRSPLERSRYACGTVEVSPGDPERSFGVLLRFAAAHPGAVLLAVDDASALFVEDHGEELARAFLLPPQPRGLARALANKREMHRLCLEHDVATPAATFPCSEAQALEHAARTGFPVVVKRIDAALPAASVPAPNVVPASNVVPAPVVAPAPNVVVAHDRTELLAAYRAMQASGLPNAMLQEHVPGGPAADWMFNGYIDRAGRCPVAFTGVKLRQAPPGAGAATLGVCRDNRELVETAERLLRAVGYRGIVDVDYRRDPRDGRYKLLDVNPRIGASFRLFLAGDGTDVLRAMYLDLTGRPVPSGVPQREGRRWIVEPQDLRYTLANLRRPDLTVREWAGSFRHVEEAAWWAREDPGPFLALAAELAGGRVRRSECVLVARRAPRAPEHDDQGEAARP